MQQEMTKTDYLKWINSTLDTNYISIESLGDCIGYTQLLHIYFPEQVNFHKIEFLKTSISNRRQNAKILEKSLKKINSGNDFNISTLANNKFPENFKFITWLFLFLKKKKVFDSNYHALEQRCIVNNLTLADRDLFHQMAVHLFPKEFYYDDKGQKNQKKNQFKNLKKKTVNVMENQWEIINQIIEVEKDNQKIVKILKKIEEITNNSKSSIIQNQIEEILQSPPDYDLSLR